MSWIKDNKFVVALGGGTLVGVIVIFLVGMNGMNRFEKAKSDFDASLAQATELRSVLDPMTTSYFLSRDIVVPTFGRAMALWRQKLFSQMHRSASAAADFLKLPNNAVVELGSKIEM